MNFKSTIRPILAEMLFWVCTGILQTLLERARHGCAPKREEQGGGEIITLGCVFCTLRVEITFWGKLVHLICMSWLVFQVLPSEEIWKPQEVHGVFYHFCKRWIDQVFCFLSSIFFSSVFFTHYESQQCQVQKLLQALQRRHWVHCTTGKQCFLENL